MIYGLDPVHISGNRFGVRIMNSWGSRWKNKGMDVLAESKARAFEQFAIFDPTASEARGG